MHSSTHSLEPHSAKPVWRIRVALLVCAAAIGGVALWSSKLPRLSVVVQEPTVVVDSAVPRPVLAADAPALQSGALDVPTEPRGTDASASKVPLPLILSSTSPGRNPREGFALLGVDAGTPQTYAAGALLANGARLLEIYPDRVLLEREGRTVELTLSGTPTLPDTKAAEETLLFLGGEQEALLPESGSSEVITDYVRPSPVFEGVQFKGLRVIPGINAHIFTQWGLESGDVITAVEGVALTDQRQAVAQLRQVSAGTPLLVSLQRDGLLYERTLDGSLIAEDGVLTVN